MKRPFLVGLIVLFFGFNARVEAGTCTSRDTGIHAIGRFAQSEMTIQQFDELKAQSPSGAILAAKRPSPELVDYLINSPDETLLYSLIEELRERSSQDFDKSRMEVYQFQKKRGQPVDISNAMHNWASYRAIAGVNIQAVWDSIIDAYVTGPIAEVYGTMVPITDGDLVSVHAVEAYENIAKYKFYRGAKNALKDAIKKWFRGYRDQLSSPNPHMNLDKIYKIYKLFGVAWMTQNGAQFREDAYLSFLSRTKKELSLRYITEQIAERTWKNLNPGLGDFPNNPYVKFLIRPLFDVDPNQEIMQVLCSARDVPRLSEKSLLRVLPMDVLRGVAEQLYQGK